MTRTMGDMFAVLDVIVADDPDAKGDFWREQKAVALPLASAVRPVRYADLAKPDALRGKRIGVPTMYIGKDKTGKPIPVRPSILALWEKTVAALRAQGAEVVEVDFPIMHNYDMDRPEAQGFVARGLIPEEWFPYVRNGTRSGSDLDFSKLNPYAWENFVADNGDPQLLSWRQVDPATVFPNLPGSVDYKRIGPARDYAKAKATILAGVQPIDSLPKFAEGMRGLEQIRKVDFEDWLDASKLDLIAFPSAADIGRANADVDEAAYDHATSNGVSRSNTNSMLRHLGIPSVSVTMGLLSDIGMPVNVTFAGKAYSDNLLLSYGYAYEQATHNRRPPARIEALADEHIDYDPAKTVPPHRRKDKIAPTVTIQPAPTRIGEALVLAGTASDAGGTAAVRVYVNGRRVPASGTRQWSARLANADLRNLTGPSDKSVTVTVLAKDKAGNAGASSIEMDLPPQP